MAGATTVGEITAQVITAGAIMAGVITTTNMTSGILVTGWKKWKIPSTMTTTAVLALMDLGLMVMVAPAGLLAHMVHHRVTTAHLQAIMAAAPALMGHRKVTRLIMANVHTARHRVMHLVAQHRSLSRRHNNNRVVNVR